MEENTADMLKYALENGIIDIALVQKNIEMRQKQELLDRHPYKIWEGNDGSWHTYIPKDNGGRIHKKLKNKKDLEKIICDFWREKSCSKTIDDVFNEWNDRRLELNEIKPATHLRDAQVYKRHFKEFGHREIKDVEKEEILDFLEEQIAEHSLTAKGFCNLKGVVKGIFKRARRMKLIEYTIETVLLELDVGNFKKVKKEDFEEVFDDQEMNVILHYLKEHLDARNLGILLMFITGIRTGELVALKHCDIDSYFINIRRTETKYKENGVYVHKVDDFPKTSSGWRTVVVPDNYMWVINKIRAISPFTEYVFCENGKRLTTQSIRKRLYRLCEKLGIHKKSPHKIRKTYGSILLDNHIDNKLIIGQMGHSSVSCTENHYHRNRKTLEKKRNIISSIPEFNYNRTYV